MSKSVLKLLAATALVGAALPVSAQTLGLGLDQHGFLSSDKRLVVLAGTTLEPMNMAETVASAGRAASAVATCLAKE